MTNVTRIRHALPVSEDVATALSAFDAELMQVIQSAKDAGLPQGFIVALLHARAQEQTQAMLTTVDAR